MQVSTQGMVGRRRLGRAVLTLMAMCIALLGAASSAQAGVSLSIGPSIRPNVTVGQTGVPAALAILNTSRNVALGEVGFETDSLRINSITLVPSCGSPLSAEQCPMGSFDPGVIVPNPLTATGRAGTACAGRTFMITLIAEAQGRYLFTPDEAIILGPSNGSGASPGCDIDFRADVRRAPSIDSRADAGLQTDQKASVTATDIGPTNDNRNGAGAGTTGLTVALASPAINTQASPTIVLGGGTLTDTATVSGLVRPVTGAGAGTVTFMLYGPDDVDCSNVIFTSPNRPLTLNAGATAGTATSAPPFTPTAAGTYRWIASYSGDANNLPVAGNCFSANEQTLVRPRPEIAVVKTVAPAVRPVPGGQFTFTVRVSNPGPERIQILTLTDNVYGNIANTTGPRFTDSTCGTLINTFLDPGAQSAPCTFVGTFTSPTPAVERDVVTVTGVGVTSRVPVNANDDAVVRLVPPPQIVVVKDVDPGTRPVPGGQFTFTVQVSNPGPEAVRILTLTDNVYGNIANATGERFTDSTCGALIGTVLAPGAQSAPCTFVGTFTSATPASETDVVTVTGRGEDSGLPVTDDDDAVVTLTPATNPPPPPPPPPPPAQVAVVDDAPAGTARVIAPSECVTRNFNVQVVGRAIRRVVFYLDGKKVQTLNRPNRGGNRFALPVRPNSLRRGTHRVLAVTSFSDGTRTRKLRVTFSRCARRAVAPRFTG